ncbi:MAG: ATP-binding cassette domain-containing protein [Kiloniellales bacterium]|nr:ATP-binding cassette domain-containing protein [Kiloniellales bacterium]
MLSVTDLTRLGLGPYSFTVESGECVALRGPSGAGKSLLLRAIADLDPNDGRVSLDGEFREAMPAPDWRRRVAYLAAEAGWWAEKVADHFPDWSAARPLVEALGLPADCGDWPVARLSTGEKQRLALVRSLLMEPRALLLDEPTSGLDPDAIERVEALIRSRQDEGVSVLWVTHDRAQAGRVAGRWLEIENGALREVSR